jgi:hypothetical protein
MVKERRNVHVGEDLVLRQGLSESCYRITNVQSVLHTPLPNRIYHDRLCNNSPLFLFRSFGIHSEESVGTGY